jgi:hypothetical protein
MSHDIPYLRSVSLYIRTLHQHPPPVLTILAQISPTSSYPIDARKTRTISNKSATPTAVMASRTSSALRSPSAARRPHSLARNNTPRRCSTASNMQSERGYTIDGHHPSSLNVTHTDESQDLVAVFTEEVRIAMYELMEEGLHAVTTVYRTAMTLGRLSMRAATLTVAVGCLTVVVGTKTYAWGKRLWSRFFG